MDALTLAQELVAVIDLIDDREQDDDVATGPPPPPDPSLDPGR